MATNGVAIPTGPPIGYTSDEVWFHQIYHSVTAETPIDTLWPTNVRTYTSMRYDPQLAGILAAYTLPIRRAEWRVNPAGCRPAVAQVVADDLGLKLLGDDEPKAARVRGVSWPEHLRTALLHLVWGHMGFELGATINDAGQARLTSLSERMPYTIVEMIVDRNGGLTGVMQHAQLGDVQPDPIPDTQLLWYCHDREGANWAGISMLRASYTPFVLKRELLRILATSNRRFGVGVPSVRWLPGTNPTPAQHAAANTYAQLVRGGESNGGALPPGAVLELLGQSGGQPDTLAFVEYLDKQATRSALAGILDMPAARNGSRSLGETVTDFLMLSQAAIAQSIADTITRQVAARIVEWNWGPDEPVPAVEVGDIGASHEVTAESLAQLMQFGAITPDPALDKYVRDLYGLPVRTGPWIAPKGEAGPSPTPNPTPAPTPAPNPAAVQAGAVRAASGGDGSDQVGNRAPTDDEVAAGVDFQQLADQHAAAVTGLLKSWPGLTSAIVAGLATAAAAAVATNTVSTLADLTVPTDFVVALADGLAVAMDKLSAKAASGAVAEAKHQGVKVAKPARPGGDDNTAVADVLARLIADGLKNAAVRTALQQSGGTETEVRTAVQDALKSLGDSDSGWAADNVNAAMSAAQAAGRAAVMSQAPAGTVWLASERLDANSCQPCRDEDLKRFDTWEDALAAYPISGFRGCLGRSRCRGQLVTLYPTAKPAP